MKGMSVIDRALSILCVVHWLLLTYHVLPLDTLEVLYIGNNLDTMALQNRVR